MKKILLVLLYAFFLSILTVLNAYALNWDIQDVYFQSNCSVGSPSIDLDSFQNPHISFIQREHNSFSLMYSSFDGSWNSERVSYAGYYSNNGDTSLALDSSNNPHITYHYAYRYENLRYTKHNGFSWDVPIDISGGFCSGGVSNSLALDASDRPHVIYAGWRDYTGRNLRYTFCDEEVWQTDFVEIEKDVGRGSRMVLDVSGRAHVCYYDLTNGKIKYAFNSDAGWKIEAAGEAGTSPTGLSCSIALDTTEAPAIAYMDTFNKEIKLVSYSDEFWHSEVIEELGDNWDGISLDFDNEDNPFMVYSNDDIIKFARWNGSSWQIEEISSGFCPSMAVDDVGNIHLSYVSGSSLMHAYAAIPEPSTFLLFMIAIPGIFIPLCRRGNRKQNNQKWIWRD